MNFQEMGIFNVKNIFLIIMTAVNEIGVVCVQRLALNLKAFCMLGILSELLSVVLFTLWDLNVQRDLSVMCVMSVMSVVSVSSAGDIL